MGTVEYIIDKLNKEFDQNIELMMSMVVIGFEPVHIYTLYIDGEKTDTYFKDSHFLDLGYVYVLNKDELGDITCEDFIKTESVAILKNEIKEYLENMKKNA